MSIDSVLLISANKLITAKSDDKDRGAHLSFFAGLPTPESKNLGFCCVTPALETQTMTLDQKSDSGSRTCCVVAY